MSLEYKPLDHAREEIRVITIHPPVSSSASSIGRTYNPWNPRYVDINPGHANGEKDASAVRLSPAEEIVHCTIDIVSLNDITNEYRAYQSSSADQCTWPEYLLDGTRRFRRRRESSSFINRLVYSCINRIHQDRPLVFELPAWRAVHWQSEDSKDERLENLRQTEHYAPRYKWGDFEALSYTWGIDDLEGQAMINGQLIRVGKNVEDALRRLRALPETEHGMRFWIDALCIN